MKIINEKGKLFGVINVIDLVILVAVILVAAAAVYKFAGPKVGEAIAPKSDMYVSMRIRGAMDYLEAELSKMQPGDKLVAGNGFVDAEVVSVSSIPYLSAANTADGKFVTAADPQKYDVIVTVKAEQSKTDPIYKIGTQEVRIGRGFILKTQTVEVNTIIETVEFNG